MSTSQPAEPVVEAPLAPASMALATIDAEPVRTVERAERNYGPENSLSAFQSQSSFDSAQRMAKALASSTMVPKDYQGSIANCLVAMELASRTGASVLAVMQNTHIINGRPSWASTFLIGSVNSCGRFTALRYEMAGGDDPKAKSYKVRAFATEKATGEKLVGEWIDWAMVDGEGWSKKNGSKWITLPGQMFRYRAAAFWTRAYAPEISLGMHASDEIEDVTFPTTAQANVAAATTGSDKLRALVDSPALRAGGVTIAEEPGIGPVTDVSAIEEAAALTPEAEPELSRKATPAKEESVAKESQDEYVSRMKTLKMRRDQKKALTKAELDELTKYEAVYE